MNKKWVYKYDLREISHSIINLNLSNLLVGFWGFGVLGFWGQG